MVDKKKLIFLVVTHPRNATWPMKSRERLASIKQTKVIRCDTELELLEQFIAIMQRSDPDILIGYDCGFQFDVLMSKIFSLKVKNWSAVGKLRRLQPPHFKVNHLNCFKLSLDLSKIRTYS